MEIEEAVVRSWIPRILLERRILDFLRMKYCDYPFLSYRADEIHRALFADAKDVNIERVNCALANFKRLGLISEIPRNSSYFRYKPGFVAFPKIDALLYF